MPIQYNVMRHGPDPLSSDRHQLIIDSPAGVDAGIFNLRHSRITFPADGVGHIQVKLLGHSVGFAGGLVNENTLTTTFIENARGAVVMNLIAWRQLTRNRETGLRVLKKDYARSGAITVYDTTGTKALEFEARGMFPLNIEFFELGEDVAAAEVQVQWNVDTLILKSTGKDNNPSMSVSEMRQRYGDRFQ